MPKMAPSLSAIELKRLSHSGGGINEMVAAGDVPGLYIQLLPGGGKTWILRAKVGPRRRDIGLGGYPEIGLAAARDKARDLRDIIRQGRDPIAERKAARAKLSQRLTFAEAMDHYLAAKLDEFRNDKHKAQWRSSLQNYAIPVIGEMPVQDIGVSEVLRVLEPIWTTKTETASRVRGRMESILAWATVSGHRSGDNPARWGWGGNLKQLLPKPSKVAKSDNQPALSLGDAPAWFAALRQRDGMGARALEFLTLCASRSGEVRGATWGEIQGLDGDAPLWVIPASRMKAGKEHRVPLTKDAVALLKALPRFEGTDLVFPASRGGTLSDMTLSATMRRMHEAEVEAGRKGWLDPRSGRPAVPHGMRSTFRDWAAEGGKDRDMAEIALAHRVGSEVERAYRRSDMLERRRAMMAEWSQFLEGK